VEERVRVVGRALVEEIAPVVRRIIRVEGKTRAATKMTGRPGRRRRLKGRLGAGKKYIGAGKKRALVLAQRFVKTILSGQPGRRLFVIHLYKW
jgi:hypothetical protein